MLVVGGACVVRQRRYGDEGWSGGDIHGGRVNRPCLLSAGAAMLAAGAWQAAPAGGSPFGNQGQCIAPLLAGIGTGAGQPTRPALP